MTIFKSKYLTIANITLVTASINNPDNITTDNHTAKHLRFGFAFDKYINVNKNALKIELHTQIDCVDEKKLETGVNGKFTIQFIFIVNRLKNYVKVNEGKGPKFSIDPILNATTLSIVYSTTRGIIFNRCLGTIMGNVILPILDTNELIKIAEATIKGQDDLKNQKGKARKKVSK